jgi:hypothetical protein
MTMQLIEAQLRSARSTALLTRAGIVLVLAGATGCGAGSPAAQTVPPSATTAIMPTATTTIMQQTTMATEAATQQPTAPAMEQITALAEETMSYRSKIEVNLLHALGVASGKGVSPALTTVTVDADGTVEISIRAVVTDELVNQITATGAQITYTDAPTNTIDARAPLGSIEPIAKLPQVVFVVPKQQATTRTFDAPAPNDVSPRIP